MVAELQKAERMNMENLVFSTWGKWKDSSGLAQTDDLPAQFGKEKPLKAFMGWNGMFVWDASVNIVDMTREYSAQAAKHSCGHCAPCRECTYRMSAILERICEGQGTEGDLDMLEYLARFVMDSSYCDIGLTSPRPVLDAIEHGRSDFLKAIKEKKPIPRANYVAKITAPCINACPSHLDIPGYVEKIHLGRWEEALEIIRRDCCLPGTIGRVCVRPCEFNCRRGLMDEPIAIKALKRFAADRELARGVEPEFLTAEAKQEKVAIIGAGPSGLSCAYYLGRRGYKTTIFEALPEPGGMAKAGIPDYRLPPDILNYEVSLVEKVGAEIRYGVNVGQDVTMDDLAKEGYKAVFVGVGAPEASAMRCEGEDAGYERFMTGIHFLREIAFGRRPIEGKKIAVIGGGNVAMDCVRSAMRIGFDDVNLIYRRTEAEMPADAVEIEEAKEEGIKFNFLVQPIKILAENGKVSGLECLKMELGEPDESGRRRPIPIEGSNFVIECDAMVPAIGQVVVVDRVLPEGTEITRWKTLVVDDITFQSSQPNVFGGGDCITGPATLIAALAAGKNAARFIAHFLETGECKPEDADWMDKAIGELGVYDPKEKMPFAGQTQRPHLKALDPATRIKSFDEVESGVSPAEAFKESARCLRCYRIGLAAV
ncbi:MAG: FAD-dependent oxidoreductase [Desulfobacteraceae bacterium]|nr:MAG: FAD-dependent oxidoreductase [Desulfobacteraceae bacterium]